MKLILEIIAYICGKMGFIILIFKLQRVPHKGMQREKVCKNAEAWILVKSERFIPSEEKPEYEKHGLFPNTEMS